MGVQDTSCIIKLSFMLLNEDYFIFFELKTNRFSLKACVF